MSLRLAFCSTADEGGFVLLPLAPQLSSASRFPSQELQCFESCQNLEDVEVNIYGIGHYL